MGITVHGTCADGFEGVQAEFEKNFTERGDVGAAVSVSVDGEFAVDLWAGDADDGGSRPWRRDTLVNVYSTGKGLTALCAHLLADRGELDLDAPVARYWPQFAQAGKGDIPVRWLLSHRAGLLGPRERLADGEVYDWDRVCAALAAAEPWWEPGAEQGYHAVTFGFLVGEVVRRITGVSLGTFLREEITEPLGADLFIGTPEAEQGRCADILGTGVGSGLGVSGLPKHRLRSLDEHPLAAFAVAMTYMPLGDVNGAEFRSAELPAVNGQASARGLATVYRALANGELVGRGTLEAMREQHSRDGESDRVLSAMVADRMPFAWGAGYMLNTFGNFGPNPGTFGHGGAGGSLAFADPENRVSYAYTMNKFGGSTTGGDVRNLRLVEAVYAALEARPG